MAGSRKTGLIPASRYCTVAPFTQVQTADPEGLFQALETLRDANALPGGFRLVFRGSDHTEYLESLIREHGLAALVELQPQVIHSVALEEMLQSQALLVIQGPSSNPAIPAKLYEYFRARLAAVRAGPPRGRHSRADERPRRRRYCAAR